MPARVRCNVCVFLAGFVFFKCAYVCGTGRWTLFCHTLHMYAVRYNLIYNTLLYILQLFTNFTDWWTHVAHTQPSYGSLDFVRDNQSEPVPEETFTHMCSIIWVNCRYFIDAIYDCWVRSETCIYTYCLMTETYLNYVLLSIIFWNTHIHGVCMICRDMHRAMGLWVTFSFSMLFEPLVSSEVLFLPDLKTGVTHTHTHNRFTALLEYVRDHSGEQVPER